MASSPAGASIRRHSTVLGFAFVFWTVFGVLSAGQIYVREQTGAQPVSFASLFNIVYFYWGWALLTPAVLHFARAAADARAPWWRAIAGQLPRGVAIVLLQTLLYAVFQHIDGRPEGLAFIETWRSALVRHAAGNVLTYVVLVATLAGFISNRRARARATEAAQHVLEGVARESELQATLVRTQLQALQAQLQPHFLFNTLNMVSTLVAKSDREGANRVIARLGELLRVSLDRSTAHEVTLSEELTLTKPYLDIVQQRFGDRLEVTTSCEAAALSCLVPTLLLQPFVENAIRHGVGARETAGHIGISARCVGAHLIIRVRDDGPGFPATPSEGDGGVGLANARARLRGLYGEEAQLVTGNAADGGAEVTVILPIRRPPAESGAEQRAVA